LIGESEQISIQRKTEKDCASNKFSTSLAKKPAVIMKAHVIMRLQQTLSENTYKFNEM